MTVRVNKDAFNVREKLSELDYDRLPYDKMPAGSVIQTVYSSSDSATRITLNSNTPTELTTSLRTTINLKKKNSFVLVTWTFGHYMPANTYLSVLPHVSTDNGSNFSTVVDYSGSTHNEMYRTGTTDFEFNTQSVTFADLTTTESTRMYSLFGRTNGGAIYIGDNQMRPNIVVQEIAQ